MVFSLSLLSQPVPEWSLSEVRSEWESVITLVFFYYTLVHNTLHWHVDESKVLNDVNGLRAVR